MDAAVGLVGGYLRVNGYFALDSFEVHVEERGGYRSITDLDIVAIRPPTAHGSAEYRSGVGAAECLVVTEVDSAFAISEDVFDIVLAEVKAGEAVFNPGIRRPEVLHAALRRVGDVHGAGLDHIVDDLLARGSSVAPMARTRLVAFGSYGIAQGGTTFLLADLLAFLQSHLAAHQALYRASQLADPVLGLLGLFDKLD